MEKQCAICGKTFAPRCNRQLTCSKECSKERRRQRHREYIKEMRQKERKITLPLKVKTCVICGRTYEAHDRRRLTCSAECRRIEHRESALRGVKRLRYEGKITERTCIVCGKTFDPHGTRALLCSDECKRLRRLAVVREVRGMYKEEGVKMRAVKVNVRKLPKPYLGYKNPALSDPQPMSNAKIARLKSRIAWGQSQKTARDPYTAEELETVRKMWEDGETLTMIGKKVGRTPAAIGGLIKRLEKEGKVNVRRVLSV